MKITKGYGVLLASVCMALLSACNSSDDGAGSQASGSTGGIIQPAPGTPGTDGSAGTTGLAQAELSRPSPSGLGMISVSSTMYPLSLVGYSAAEYFAAGAAANHEFVTPATDDGYWQTRMGSDKAAYKTRIVVYRPSNPARFNGTVVIEWLNVSGGLDAAPEWINAHTELIRSGYAWVGVSAQKEGIDGGGMLSMLNLPLKSFDARRYGGLSHPGNRYSYDIFSQVAQAIRHPRGLNPLEGLTVNKLVAAGHSQSAMRLVTYINGVAPLTRLFDGYMVHGRPFGHAPLSDDSMGLPDDYRSVMRIRTDQAPVLNLQTETDLLLLNSHGSRQPDGDNFRLWEIAGAAHVDRYTLTGLFDVNGSDVAQAVVAEDQWAVPALLKCEQPINSGPQHFISNAAYAALQRWITAGVAPAQAERLQVAASGRAYEVDVHGNALGGIRTPYVDVPIARLSGLGQTFRGGQQGGIEDVRERDSFCLLFGSTRLFDASKLKTLYPTHAAYVNAVAASADLAVTQGFLLPPDAALIKKAAQQSTVGN